MATSVESVAGEAAYKVPLKHRAASILRVYIFVQLLVIVAWGVYDVFLETGVPLSIHFGSFVVAYHIGQHVATNTDWWHHVQPIDFYRHGYRKILESVVAGAGGMVLGLNALSARRLRKLEAKPNLLDRLEMFLRIPNWKDNEYRARKGLPPLSGWQVFSAFTFLPVIYALIVIVPLLHFFAGLHTFTVAAVGPGWAQYAEELFTGPIVYLVIGFVAAPVAKRPVAPVVDDMQRWRSQVWAVKGKTVERRHRILFPDAYLERIRRTKAEGVEAAQHALDERGWTVKVMMVLGLMALVAFFVVGAYFRLFVA